MVHITRATIQK